MIAKILTKYIHKVKEFSKENASYHIIGNVKFVGTKDALILSCCDGDSGITQKINQQGTPIIGEFCINVFHLYKILSKIPEQDDIEFHVSKINYIINIKTPTAKFSIPGFAPDQVFELTEHTVFKEVETDFFDKLSYIAQMNLDDTYPIVYNGEYIYYASSHIIVYIKKIIDILPFKTNTKIVQKLLVDKFTHIDITENQIHLKNEHCQIFIPQIIVKSPMIDPVVKVVQSHNLIAGVNIQELKSSYGIIEGLQVYDEYGIRSVELTFEKNVLILNYQDSEFIICNVNFDCLLKIAIKIPHDYLKIITDSTFTQNHTHVNVLLTENNKMFVAQQGCITLVGGLSKI